MSTSPFISITQSTANPVIDAKHLNERLAMAERNEQSLVNFKIDVVVKEAAEATLSSMGISTSAYLGMCLRQLAQERKLPFVFEADPEFWIAEAQVGRAAELVRSGLFEKTVSLKEQLVKHILSNERGVSFHLLDIMKKQREVVDEDDSFECACIDSWYAFLAGFESDVRAMGFSKLALYFSDKGTLSLLANNMLPDNSWGQLFKEAVSAFRSEESLFLDRSIVDFCVTEGIGGSAGKFAPSKEVLDLAGKLDTIIGSVLDEYEEHRSSFSLRFVGAESYISNVQKTSLDVRAAKEEQGENGMVAKQNERQEEYQRKTNEAFEQLLALMDRN